MNEFEVGLFDIEGTITDIQFVHQVLFPYAKEKMASFISNNKSSEVQDIIQKISRQFPGREPIELLQEWMQQDQKVTELKELQGLLWAEGYKRGDFQGHLYQDAFDYIERLKEQGKKLYIYSSGSIKAQKLLLQHTKFGDLTSLFSGFFDTHIGQKKQSESYHAIAKAIEVSPERICFYSDSQAEIRAARQANFQAILIERESQTELDSIQDFKEY